MKLFKMILVMSIRMVTVLSVWHSNCLANYMNQGRYLTLSDQLFRFIKILLVVSSVNNDTGWVIKLSEIYRS